MFQCMINAWSARATPEHAERWFKQADKLEAKFNNQFGRHYSHFLGEQ